MTLDNEKTLLVNSNKRGTRRNFLQMTGTGMALLSQPSLGLVSFKLVKDSLANYDGIALAALVKSGEESPKEFAEASILRAEALDGRLNAVVARTFDQALDRATSNKLQGPFAGVPFSAATR